MSETKVETILVAEDDYIVGKEIVRLLSEIGYEQIAEAFNGNEAVEKVCSLQPDVVLMDIQMPQLDGLEATRQIQDCCPTPVIILTAYETKELLEKASKAGVAAYLTKPPGAGELERAITIALARHNDLMALRRFSKELEEKNEELQEALTEIKTLRSILPLCSFCKKIRDDDGYWEQVDVYIHKHLQADISHSICPECMKEHYPEEYESIMGNKGE